jgi:serine/threonine-protein phosphatase 2B regulatory subunit
VINRDDMAIMLKQLAGSSLSEDNLQEVVTRVLAEAGCSAGIDLEAFKAALRGADLEAMTVDVPIRL